jgi:general secretion pathway protein H
MRSSRCRAGFTLLEIMVVLVLIGIVSTLAVFSIGEPSRQQLGNEAERVQALLQLASEEAMLTSREYGVIFYRDGYSFVIHDPRNESAWTPLEQGTFRRRQLPDGVTLSLFVEGLAATGDETMQNALPQLVLFAAGGRTPFRLRFDYQGKPLMQLSGAYYGELELITLEP